MVEPLRGEHDGRAFRVRSPPKDSVTWWHQWMTLFTLPLLVLLVSGLGGWICLQLVDIPTIKSDLTAVSTQIERLTQRVDRLYEGNRFGRNYYGDENPKWKGAN